MGVQGHLEEEPIGKPGQEETRSHVRVRNHTGFRPTAGRQTGCHAVKWQAAPLLREQKQRKGERETHFSSAKAKQSPQSKPRQMGAGRPQQAVGHSTLQSVPHPEGKGAGLASLGTEKKQGSSHQEWCPWREGEGDSVSVRVPACALHLGPSSHPTWSPH